MKICSNCFQPTDRPRRNMCHRCYEYRRRKGVMRPPSPVAWEGVTQRQPKVHDPDSPRALACVNCLTGDVYAFSMCFACRQYLIKNKRNRPPELYTKTQDRCSDVCKNPTTTSRMIQVGWPNTHQTRLPLCESCARLFDAEERNYSNNSVPGTYHRPGFTGYAKW